MYHLPAVLRILSGVLFSVMAATPVAVQVPTVLAADVTQVILEERCFGCGREMVLTLKRDRTATKTVPGVARTGTRDQQFTAILPPEEFDRLARAIVDAGFFALSDEYRDPRVADAA